MTPQDITIGTRLEFEMLDNSGNKVGNTFVSQLLETEQDGMMVISAPIFESRVVFVPAEIAVRLTFSHPIHGMLGFTALVKAKEYRGKIAVLIVDPDEVIEKIQRRMHFRLDIITDVLIRSTQTDNSEEKQEAEQDAPVKAYTKNISGSGTCIISEINFPRNSEVMIELHLSENVKINAKCVVIRSQTVEVRKGKSYELGMRFLKITNKDQDSLIKFIFEQQRMLLKKEK